MSFLTTAKPTITHCATPILLQTRASTVSLPSFVTPLISPFHGHPLLFNGHLQTFWTVAKFSDPYPIHYARRHLTNPRDGGHFAVDFAETVEKDPAPQVEDLPPRTRHMNAEEAEALGSDDDTPMLIALHGLSGGSHELYLRALLAPLVSGEGAWAACVVNARGCAQSKITTKQLFNAKFTQDIRIAIKYLRKIYPNRPLFAVGFSLGANILTNYLGEEGENCELKAAAVCSNPWNLELASKALHRTWLGREVYSKTMGTNLRRLFEEHFEQLKTDTRIDVAKVRAGKYLYEFDRDLTSKVFDYPTVGAYYRDASSVNNLLNVRIPLLIVHAADDPIAVEEALPYDEVAVSPYAVMVVTSGGGHLSWFEADGGRWFTKPVNAFLRAFAAEVVNVLEPKKQA